MKIQLLPPPLLEEINALTLIDQIVKDPELSLSFPREIEELKGYLDGKISAERAIQLIQAIKRT